MFRWLPFSITLLVSEILFRVQPTSGLSTTPVDRVVVVNSSTVFQCASDQSVVWSFRRTGQLAEERIYVGGQGGDARYSVNRSSSAGDWYGLVISEIGLYDAGVYTCIDNEGYGPSASARLVVLLEPLPTCGTNVSADRSVLESQVIELRCAFVYAGDPPPRVRWTSPTGVVNSRTRDRSESGSEKRLESWIVVTAAGRRIGPYQCAVTTFDGDDEGDGTESTTTPTYVWNSSSFVVHYPVKDVVIDVSADDDNVLVVGQMLRCRADGSPPARYQWNEIGSSRSFTGPDLRLDAEGLHTYECRATNVVANVSHSARARITLTVIRPPPPTTEISGASSPPTSSVARGSVTGPVVIATLTTAVVVVLLVCSAALVYRFFVTSRRRRRRSGTVALWSSSNGSSAAIIRRQVPASSHGPPAAAAAVFRDVDSRKQDAESCLYDLIDDQQVGCEQLPAGDRLSTVQQSTVAASAAGASAREFRPAVDGGDDVRLSSCRTPAENDYPYICGETDDAATGPSGCCLREQQDSSDFSVRYVNPAAQQQHPPRQRDGPVYENVELQSTAESATATGHGDEGVYIHPL